MKRELLDIEAELSCAFALMHPSQLEAEKARQHIKRAQTALLDLATVLENAETEKPSKN